jgi:hypothetical protein
MKHYIISLILFACLSLQHLQMPTKTNVFSDGPNLLRLAPDVNMLGEDHCSRHGGTVGYGRSWNIATCKSDCSRGLGFRCGGEEYAKCSDGTIEILGVRGDHCPGDKPRRISADIRFYDNNTLSLTFLSALPEEEKDNNEFEVEEDTELNIPTYLLIGDRHYASYTVKKGIYKVDRSVGEFGQVVVDFEFND